MSKKSHDADGYGAKDRDDDDDDHGGGNGGGNGNGGDGRTLIVSNPTSPNARPGDFPTIQSAVLAARDGDTILIREGVYVEQVTVVDIDNLTIRPINENARVEIKSPAVLLVNGVSETYGDSVRAVVGVTNSENFTFLDIIVDGSFAGDTSPNSNGDEVSGVALLNSSGTIRGVTIENVSNSPTSGLFGLQHGSGLFVDGGRGDPDLRVTVRDTTITDFQKTGALITGVKLDFRGNTIDGIGATGLTAQNGLQVFNAEGRVEGNTITDFGYINPPGGETYSSGIIVFEPSGRLDVTNNFVRGAPGVGAGAAGIDISDTGGEIVTITGNTLAQLGYGIVAYTFNSTIGLDPGPRIDGNTFRDITINGIWFDPETDGYTTTTPYRVEGSQFDDYLAGSNGNDTFYGRGGDDVINGRGGNDTLDGGSGDDTIEGGAGNDRIYGGPGDDRLDGGPGNDRIEGGSGNDVIIGGEGDDQLSGGSGDDTFILAGGGRDRITDFNRGSKNDDDDDDDRSGSGGRENDVIVMGPATKGGRAVIDFDTNNDGRITGADGGSDARFDFVRQVGDNLVFTFDDGRTVTVENVRWLDDEAVLVAAPPPAPLADADGLGSLLPQDVFALSGVASTDLF